MRKHEVIPTKSFGLNYALGGGLWTGRIHTLWGNYSAGKSVMAMHLAAEAQRMGYHPVIVDAEKSYTDEWATKIGIDIDNRTLLQGTIMEDIMGEVMPMMRKKEEKYFFLIDSINSVVFEQFYKNDDSAGGIGIYARSQGALMQKIANDISVDHIFVCIAQQTYKTKGQYFVNQANMAQKTEHWSTNIIHLSANDSQIDTEKNEDDVILNKKVSWTIDKSKQRSVKGMKGTYWFSPANAEIDMAQEAAHIAVRNGIIAKGGAWFTWKDEKYQGLPNLVAALTEEDLTELYRQLGELDIVETDIDD